MSCWVAPMIAAELWEIPVQQVLNGIKEGHIPSREEHGFTFVQYGSAPAAPPAPVLHQPEERPATFVLSTSEQAVDEPVTEPPETETILTEEETDSLLMADWRETRAQTGRLRKPPLAA